MGGQGQEYIDALNKNRIEKNQVLFSSRAVCLAVREFMRDKNRWEDQPNVLLKHLDPIAVDKRLGKNTHLWPKSAIEMSYQLKKYKSILAEMGITVEWGKHKKAGSTIIITKK